MRGLVLSLCIAGQGSVRLGRAGRCPYPVLFRLLIRYNSILSGEGVVSSVDAVTVELPSVIRQLESVFRPFLGILDLT